MERAILNSLTHLQRAQGLLRRLGMPAIAVCAAALIAGCSGNAHVDIANSQSADPGTVDYPIFYVKRTIPPNQDDLRMLRDAVLPTKNQTVVPKADLYMRLSASPSANEVNITTRVTGTSTYDVKDVDVSFDGKNVVFAMRGPLTANMKQKDPPTWHLWEYTLATDDLHQVIPASLFPDESNNVAPHYMPDGRIVFSSTAQRQSKAILLDEGKPQFEAQDEARTEPAFVLHVIDAPVSGVRADFHQISFNQSHDRDATVLANGRILWSRWDHAPGKDGMHLYTSNPDGTDTELYYGANSHMTGTTLDGANNAVIEFVKPKEMQDGRILTLVRPYTGTDFGGDLVIINGVQFVENTQPLLANAGLPGPAQTRASTNNVIDVPGPSPGGRFNSAEPLWDGSGRILVSWSQCRMIDPTSGAIVPCTDANVKDPTFKTAPPLYSVWMFNPAQNTLLPVMAPVEGVMVTDIVAAQPRNPQNIILDKVPGVDLDQELVNQNVGVLDIKSVYDFDGVDTAKPNIPTVADPAATTASQRPARFIRLVKPVSIPDKDLINLAGAAFGASNYMREIMGYAPIEPDGSVKIKVPANVAFEMEVLDVNGRRIDPIQAAWLQVRPGEVLSCNGCHTPATPLNPISHGRQGTFASAYAGATGGAPFPHTVNTFIPNAGESMAQTRARTSCTSDNPKCKQMDPSVNLYYSDVWTDPVAAGRQPDKPVVYAYNDATQFFTAVPARPSSCLDSFGAPSQWVASCRIVINYPTHIQALWDYTRQTKDATGKVIADHTCTQGGCHSTTPAAGSVATVQVPAGQLDLTNTASNDEPAQPLSYRYLLFQEPKLEVIMGALQPVPGPPDANGNPTVVNVGPYMDAGNANGPLSSAFLARFAPGSGSTHAGYLSPAELRMISEWLDIGAQFFNDPFDPAVPVN
jgi:Hydrazine synthase alpha subunit middle domain